MSIEAMELALEALKFVNQTGDTQTFDMCYADKTITAIKEALAQPEQLEGLKLIHKADIDLAKKRALEAQPEQEPVAWSPEDTAHRAGGLPMAQPKQEQDEPVAVVNGVYGGRFTYAPIKASVILPVGMALYTRPQPRTWVGLTDEEHNEIAIESGCMSADWVFYGAAVERKLKEKNT